jgi:hypothetical protein
MRIERGALWALTPMADAYGYQRLWFDRRLVAATPSGREIDARFGIDAFAMGRLSAHGEVGYRAQPGHRADAEGESYGTIGMRLAY